MSRGKTKRNLGRKKSLQVENKEVDKEEEEDFATQMSEMFSYPFTMLLSMFNDEDDVSIQKVEDSDEEYESDEEKQKRKRKRCTKTKRNYR